jgi:peptidoglycan hydrolase CwlO-like protein
LKRKDNEITFLKQEIANLHQIISTRVAELNSIQEKGKANDKILAKKDEEVARLTKSLSDTKERL